MELLTSNLSPLMMATSENEKPSVVPDRACPSCASFTSGNTRHFVNDVFRIVECPDCHLLFVTPLPSITWLANEYNQAYNRESVSRALNLDSTEILESLLNPAWFVSKYRPRESPGTLLEVGFGTGRFLRVMSRRGWKTIGLEFSEAAVQRGDAAGLNVRQGQLTDLLEAKDSFDVITLFHTLEHMVRPMEDLRICQEILRRSGKLVVEVPDAAGVPARILAESWPGWDVPIHLQHFVRETLVSMLERAGFTVTACSSRYRIFEPGNALRRSRWSKVDESGERRTRRLVTPLAWLVDAVALPFFQLSAYLGAGSALIVEATPTEHSKP